MRNRILLALSMVTTIFAATAAHAGSVSGNATVTINYAGACTINVASPAVSYAGSDISTSADVTVNCSTGLPYTLTANGGLNASGELRRAKTGSEYLTYRLFRDSGLTQEVGVTSNTVAAGTGTGGNQVVTPYYAVKLADNVAVPVGNFSDTVAFTLTF